MFTVALAGKVEKEGFAGVVYLLEPLLFAVVFVAAKVDVVCAWVVGLRGEGVEVGLYDVGAKP